MIAQNFESMCLSSWCVLPGSIFRRGISSSSSGFRYCSSDAFFSFGSQFGFGWDGAHMLSDIVFSYQQNAAASLEKAFQVFRVDFTILSLAFIRIGVRWVFNGLLLPLW